MILSPSHLYIDIEHKIYKHALAWLARALPCENLPNRATVQQTVAVLYYGNG